MPEDVLAPITHFHLYLRARVLLIAIMLLILLLIVLEIIQDSVTSWVAWSSLILFIGGMVWVILIVIPTGKRLGKRIDSLEEQTRLAHSLLPMHLLAFGIILAVWLLQLYGTWR